MKNVTFADEQVRGLVRGDFVSLEVNPSRDAQLVKELKITSYPTTLVISPESELLDQIKGYLPPEEFQQRLDRCRAQATAAPPRSSRR
jgi:thioredoxin-related protein